MTKQNFLFPAPAWAHPCSESALSPGLSHSAESLSLCQLESHCQWLNRELAGSPVPRADADPASHSHAAFPVCLQPHHSTITRLLG